MLNWLPRLVIFNITELRSTCGSEAQKQSVRGKLISLGITYAGSERFFPLEYVVQLMEQHSCKNSWGVEFVYEVMLEIGVSMKKLFVIYDKLFKTKVSCSFHRNTVANRDVYNFVIFD